MRTGAIRKNVLAKEAILVKLVILVALALTL